MGPSSLCRPVAALLGLAGLAVGCGDDVAPPVDGAGGAAAYDWGLPEGYPAPPVPADNPMSAVKVELGRRLFYDKRLSGNQTYSCGSCHRQELAFTDGLAKAEGSTGEHTARGAMSLVGVAYLSGLTWSNPVVHSLEDQARIPMFGEAPVELGLAQKEAELLERLSAEPLYAEMFPEAFPDEAEPISVTSVTRAIAAFERTLNSYRSPYDRYLYEHVPLPEDALRGKDLFLSERLKCFLCHGGFNLADAVKYKPDAPAKYHNTGLYNIGGTGAYPPDNTGIFATTGVPEDMGHFRAPTLRNIEVTAPYMHDGSVETLDGVLDHYAAGGRTIATGPYAGDGSKNPYKSGFVEGFELSEAERSDLLAFLRSATDRELLTDPRYADPWQDAR